MARKVREQEELVDRNNEAAEERCQKMISREEALAYCEHNFKIMETKLAEKEKNMRSKIELKWMNVEKARGLLHKDAGRFYIKKRRLDDYEKNLMESGLESTVESEIEN